MLVDLNVQCSSTSLWTDNALAQNILSERARVSKIITSFTELEEEFNYYTELLDVVKNDTDELLNDIEIGLTKLKERIQKKKLNVYSQMKQIKTIAL